MVHQTWHQQGRRKKGLVGGKLGTPSRHSLHHVLMPPSQGHVSRSHQTSCSAPLTREGRCQFLLCTLPGLVGWQVPVSCPDLSCPVSCFHPSNQD